MKKLFPWILILGGAAIAAIVIWGNSTVSEKSDAQILQEASLELQEKEQDARESAEALMKKVLSAPESCAGLSTAVVFAISDTEPDEGSDWPDWTKIANEAEQACLIDAFNQTNAHAFAIRGEVYETEAPDFNRISRFISDVSRASLFTDGVNYGDQDASLDTLITGFYADRAESRVRPSQSY